MRNNSETDMTGYDAGPQQAYDPGRVLRETREEIALLTNPETRDATAREFGLGEHLIAGYLDTLRVQERNCLRRLK